MMRRFVRGVSCHTFVPEGQLTLYQWADCADEVAAGLPG